MPTQGALTAQDEVRARSRLPSVEISSRDCMRLSQFIWNIGTISDIRVHGAKAPLTKIFLGGDDGRHNQISAAGQAKLREAVTAVPSLKRGLTFSRR